jgi:hypothetical protein
LKLRNWETKVLAQKGEHFNAVQRDADAVIRVLATAAANIIDAQDAPLSVRQISQYWLD